MFRLSAALICALLVSACWADRDRPLAPETSGLVLDAASGAPVAGAAADYPDVPQAGGAVSDAAGRFQLPGAVESRREMLLPGSGVYRDGALVRVRHDDYPGAFAWAAFLSGLGAQEDSVLVLMITDMNPSAAGLDAYLEGCQPEPAERYALALAALLPGLVEQDWFTAHIAADYEPGQRIEEFLDVMLRTRLLRRCEAGIAAQDELDRLIEPLRRAVRDTP
ncbi:MAG: carboxypeptidase regulatory-like domain-containing protein [Maricaulaceae bacterium]|nr:carboxypeptidase regulatory-like domain-containing protein [Maricaulaceae bacterium]